MTRSIGFFIWFASGVKAFQTRAVPVSATGDPQAKQKSSLIRTANKRYTRKLDLTTDFATFSVKKWLRCGKDFSFCAFDFPRSILSSVAV
ncbi:MAG: hypothetical protein ACLTSA_08670 [Faecalibacterium sp.]